MKKIIILFFSLFALSNAAGIYDGVSFTDQEEKYALIFCNYYPYQSIVNLGISTTDAALIVNSRPYTSLFIVSNLTGIVISDMNRLKYQSYITEFPALLHPLGITENQFKYFMSFAGLLMGFLFAFGLIISILQIAKGR